MKTIQCAHPPHHHDGFVATCWLWTTSGGVIWPSIAGMLPQSHCGDEDGGIGLSSRHHYICIMLFALCLLSILCVMNQFLF